MKYGKAAGYTAHAGIAKATANGTKFLILHSTDDKTISLKNSVLANVEKNDNITLITEKNKGHNSLDSDRAIKHKAQLDTLFETTYPKNQRTNKNRRELFSKEVTEEGMLSEISFVVWKALDSTVVSPLPSIITLRKLSQEAKAA